MWDQSADFVIVGSGGGGLAAALAAADAGLSTLVVEKQRTFGGSTAMSGGVIWLPDNPLMRAEGVADSHEDALAYFESVVGEVGPASTLARREAFLAGGSAMISFLQRQGVQFIRCPGYSDYYDMRKGGHAAGRSIECAPWDGSKLGDWHDKITPGQTRSIGLAFKTNEIRHLPTYARSAKSLSVAARVWLRTYGGKARGKDLLTAGMSLVGQMAKVLHDQGIPLWLNTGVVNLVVEAGRVTGVEVIRDGDDGVTRIQGRKGVLLSAGGFERNAEMRRKYCGEQPNDGRWTIANPGNTGEVLAAAIALGAQTDLMDEAWWLPGPGDGLAGTTLTMARQYPRTLYVNRAGKRFCNESNSYVEVGKAMYANDAVPAWLIFDDGFRRRYPLISGLRRPSEIYKAVPGRMPKEWVEKGWIKKADSLEDLAHQIGVDPAKLVTTVRRFNANAAKGQDPDFGRGQSAYNACLGDPGSKGNRALGPLDKPPFYATEIYPRDVGTCGGLMTNENAQVIGPHESVIPGLYATGNITATVLGRSYLGAGASIANTMVFGYIAARHAAGLPWSS